MRMRFNATEKVAITLGTVEVRTGRYWHPAVVIDARIQRSHGTFEHVVTRVTSGKYAGQIWHASPTALRARP